MFKMKTGDKGENKITENIRLSLIGDLKVVLSVSWSLMSVLEFTFQYILVSKSFYSPESVNKHHRSSLLFVALKLKHCIAINGVATQTTSINLLFS